MLLHLAQQAVKLRDVLGTQSAEGLDDPVLVLLCHVDESLATWGGQSHAPGTPITHHVDPFDQARPGEQIDLPTTAVFDPGNAVISFQPVEGALIESFTEGLHEARVIFWRIEDGPEQALSYRWEFNVI